MSTLNDAVTIDQPANLGASNDTELLPLECVVWTDADRLSGAPCFYHSRVPIKALFDYLEGGETVTSFLDDFEGVSRAQVFSAIYYGKALLMPPGVPQPTGKTSTVPPPVFHSGT